MLPSMLTVMRERGGSAVVLVVCVAVAGCFDGTVPLTAIVSCRQGADCPNGLYCMTGLDGRCVGAEAPCVELSGREATPLVDGSACGGGKVCIAAACVTPRCGDGVVTSPETCDGGVECRADCTRCGDGIIDVGEACDNGLGNSDVLPGACRTTCALAFCGDGVRDPGEGCDEGYANSDIEPDACRTTCARSTCGDGVVDDHEQCDDGPNNSDAQPGACRTTCVAAGCGDGVRDVGEACDNGRNNSDVQPGACRTICALPTCGDGVRDPGEGCDEGFANSDIEGDACRTSCARSTCGDGIIDEDEQCDDGIDNSDGRADACRTTCVTAGCGDGVLDLGEACDNGRNNSDVLPGACRTTCALATCGDGVRDPGESCDDGLANSDVEENACRTSCVRSTCGDGIVDEDEQCDDGDGNSDSRAGACRTTCVTAGCGDGVLDVGEACDNGRNNSDVQPGACRTTCALATCGDGVRDPGEGCDDGLANSDVATNACRTSCARASCGDGVIDTGEVCDDGNVRSGDGCRAECAKVERCGDAVVDEGEACDDGNDNPRDGCAGCQTQRWGVTLRVSGAVEARGAVTTNLNPSGIAIDPLGRVYTADTGAHVVRRTNLDGTITTIAGTGSPGFSGDGGPATSAALSWPSGVAVDAAGRVFVAQGNRVRRIDLDGKIATIAGTGVAGFSGDGGPASSATLDGPRCLAVDAIGRVLICDTFNRRVRRVGLDGTITTIAGSGSPDFAGDGGPATGAGLNAGGLAVDPTGRVLIADTGNQRIRRVELDGTITTVAGNGDYWGFYGDGGPATSAALGFLGGVAVDTVGRIFIAGSRRIRRVDLDGTITTIAGTGVAGFSGDGGPASSAALSPRGVAVDAAGRVFVADGARVRRIDLDGKIATIAGTGSFSFSGDGGPATSAALRPDAVVVDVAGRVLIADGIDNRIRRLEPDGRISTVAGTGGGFGFSGDGGPAASAALNFSQDVAVDAAGQVLIADSGNRRVRRVDLEGIITTIAGTGDDGFTGDGSPAISAALYPSAVAVDALGRVLIAESTNRRVRRVEHDGTLVTIAGTGDWGFSGDGGPATGAALFPADVAVDAMGRVLIADFYNARIRRVDLDGTITTIAGTGNPGFSGDGGPATSAAIRFPSGVAVDTFGRVVIADTGNNRIRRVGLNGIITTIAGTGDPGSSGDGGPATSAAIRAPSGVAVDASGHIVIADEGRVRRIEHDGTITTVAGLVHPAGPGSVERAKLYAPAALTSLPTGSLVSVGGLGRALEIDATAVGVVVGYDATSSPTALGKARFAPLLADARGIAFDPVFLTLLITEQATGDLRLIGLDPDEDGVIDDAARWTSARVTTELNGPAGIAYDDGEDNFVVADEADHCVQRIDRDGDILATVFGRCGSPGLFPGYLNKPTHTVVSPATGAVYLSDTGNHRVLRVEGGVASLVVGDGSVSSAGEGAPARLFPVNAPRQLALDALGNLYVTSTTTLRLVANVDGDADADGDDRVSTIFGGGDRLTFPESDTFCLNTVALDEAGDVYAADGCQGYLVKLNDIGP